MTSFIQPSFPTEHPGVVRIESAAKALGEMRQDFSSSKGLSAMLLVAMISALVVVADQLIDTWADGHLLAAWVALWVVGFSALIVFFGSTRQVVLGAVRAVDAWSLSFAKARFEWSTGGRWPEH